MTLLSTHRLPEFEEYSVVGESCLPALATAVFNINWTKQLGKRRSCLGSRPPQHNDAGIVKGIVHR